MKKPLQLIFALVAGGLALWLGRGAAYELFVFEPGVHYPRVSLSPTVEYRANTPTLAAAVLLVAAALALAGAAGVVAVVVSRRPAASARRYWLLQGIAFAAAASAWLVAMWDFISHAGEFG